MQKRREKYEVRLQSSHGDSAVNVCCSCFFCFVYKHLVEQGFCLNKYIVDKTCRQKRSFNVSFGQCRLPVTVNFAIIAILSIVVIIILILLQLLFNVYCCDSMSSVYYNINTHTFKCTYLEYVCVCVCDILESIASALQPSYKGNEPYKRRKKTSRTGKWKTTKREKSDKFCE